MQCIAIPQFITFAAKTYVRESEREGMEGHGHRISNEGRHSSGFRNWDMITGFVLFIDVARNKVFVGIDLAMMIRCAGKECFYVAYHMQNECF